MHLQQLLPLLALLITLLLMFVDASLELHLRHCLYFMTRKLTNTLQKHSIIKTSDGWSAAFGKVTWTFLVKFAVVQCLEKLGISYWPWLLVEYWKFIILWKAKDNSLAAIRPMLNAARIVLRLKYFPMEDLSYESYTSVFLHWIWRHRCRIESPYHKCFLECTLESLPRRNQSISQYSRGVTSSCPAIASSLSTMWSRNDDVGD